MPRSFQCYLQHRISTLSKREMFGDVTGKNDFTGSLSKWGFHCQKHRQFSGLITHQAGQARMIAGKVRHFLHMTPFPTHHFSEVGSEVGVIYPDAISQLGLFENEVYQVDPRLASNNGEKLIENQDSHWPWPTWAVSQAWMKQFQNRVAKNEDCHLMDYDKLHWQYIGYTLIPHHESNIIYESYPYQQNSLSNRINQSSMVLKPYCQLYI